MPFKSAVQVGGSVGLSQGKKEKQFFECLKKKYHGDKRLSEVCQKRPTGVSKETFRMSNKYDVWCAKYDVLMCQIRRIGVPNMTYWYASHDVLMYKIRRIGTYEVCQIRSIGVSRVSHRVQSFIVNLCNSAISKVSHSLYWYVRYRDASVYNKETRMYIHIQGGVVSGRLWSLGHTLNPLLPATRIEFSVRAKNTEGWGEKTALLTACTLSGLPDLPEDVCDEVCVCMCQCQCLWLCLSLHTHIIQMMHTRSFGAS